MTFDFFTFIYIHTMVVCAGVPWHICGSQRTTCLGLFFHHVGVEMVVKLLSSCLTANTFIQRRQLRRKHSSYSGRTWVWAILVVIWRGSSGDSLHSFDYYSRNACGFFREVQRLTVKHSLAQSFTELCLMPLQQGPQSQGAHHSWEGLRETEIQPTKRCCSCPSHPPKDAFPILPYNSLTCESEQLGTSVLTLCMLR